LELDYGRRALVLVTRKGSKFYHLFEVPTQLGGRAFRLEPFSMDRLATGESDYTVLLAGPDTSCTCPGHSYTGGCKHASSLLGFQAEGRLS
jgi:hypothetical protein